MGFPKHYLGKPREPSPWAATVGAMKASGVRVKAGCGSCDWWLDPLPLDPIIAQMGPDFTLYDRRPKCRQPGCSGRVLFFVSAGEGTPYRPCIK